MNSIKSALCAAFVVLVSVASAEVLPQLPTFYTWVKNPNSAPGGDVTRAREGYLDTGVPAKSGIEIEAEIQFETAHKPAYSCGMAVECTTGDNQGFLAPLLFNSNSNLDDTGVVYSYISLGYGDTRSDIQASDIKTGKSTTHRTIHARLAAGEQWMYIDGDKKIEGTNSKSYDLSDRTFYLFASNLDGGWDRGGPFILYSFKIYTVEGTGEAAVRTLVRDYVPCESDGKPAVYDLVNGTITVCKGRRSGSGAVLSSEEAIRNDVLTVTADPETCAPVSPAASATSGLTEDYTETFVAPEGVVQVDESTKAACKGWKLYEYNGETKTWDLKNELTSRTCDYSHTGAANVRRLVWQWETAYSVSATTEDPTATVTASKDAAEPGEEVTFTAIAGEGRAFWKWTGDVPAEHVHDAMFTMPITKATDLVAVFADRIPVAVGGDIQAALNGASAGDVIELAQGDHLVTTTLAVGDGKRLIGAGRDATRIVLNAALANDSYIVTLTDAESEIAGLTITATDATAGYKCEGGLKMTGGRFADGRITGLYSKGYAVQGLGVNMTGGTLLRTEVTGNLLASSGGSKDGCAGVHMTGGLVEDCQIMGNKVDFSTYAGLHGGGLKITGGRVIGTLIANNVDRLRTSGVAATGGTLENCTIVSNLSTRAEGWGGVYNNGAAFVGCTIFGNRCYEYAEGKSVIYNVRRGEKGSFTDCMIGDREHPGTPTAVTVGSVEALESALAGACDGSVITIASGEYALASVLCLTNAVTIRGAGRPESVVLRKASGVAFVLRNSDAKLENLSVADCKATPIVIIDGGLVAHCRFTGNETGYRGEGEVVGGGVVRMFVSGTLSDCRFVGNGVSMASNSDGHGGAIFYEGSGGEIDRCLFVSNRIETTSLTAKERYRRGSALYVQGVIGLKSCLFARNYFVNSCGAGAVAFLNSNGWTSNTQRSKVSNCTIADNTTAFPRTLDNFYDDTVAGMTLYDNALVDAVNCILDGNVDYSGAVSNVYVYTGSQLSLTYSDVDAGSSVAGGEGNISEDPLFKNRAANSYQLAADSPCVNTGTNADWMATAVDLRGKPRIAEGIVDMGAYEQQNVGLMLLFR